MKGAIAWFAENSVAANLLMALIVAGGLFSVFSIPKEVTPEISTNLIVVQVPYPGATPAEVEQAISIRVEEEVASLDDIRRVTSISTEGLGRVMIELLPDADMQRALGDVKSRVDAIDTFPEDAEEPLVSEVTAARQVISVSISADTDEKSLKQLGERIRDDITNLPSVTKTVLTGTRPYEISIEVSEERLRQYGLTFAEVAAAIRNTSLDLPGGSIKSSEGERLLRVLGQSYTGAEFERLVLRTGREGERLRLGDVATVVDGFEDVDASSRLNGRPQVMVQVFRVGNQSALQIAAEVRDYIKKAEAWLPDGVSLTLSQDDTRILRGRLELLIRNGLQGFVLVFLSLALFLQLRLAAWVTLGVPMSFLGALWFMPGLGATINLISLFAFIVVLGIIVDDAIVVGENIYTHMQRGDEPLDAVKSGAIEMATPVTFAVLTTVAAFAVLLGIRGTMGQFARQIPIVVISALGFSLMECLFVLPAHLRHIRVTGVKLWYPLRWWGTIQTAVSSSLAWFIRAAYQPFLDLCLRWRYVTLSTGIAVLLITLGIVAGGWLKLTFFPTVDADNVAAMLTMPQGTSIEQTKRAVAKLEKSANALAEELNREYGQKLIRYVMASNGSQPFRTAQSQNAGNLVAINYASNLGEVMLELAPSEERDVKSAQIAKRWRKLTEEIPGATELVFTATLIPTGDAIDVQLSAENFDNLELASERLKKELGTYAGVFDIRDSLRVGKTEVKLRMKKDGEQLGLRVGDLARQVRQAFHGEEAQRVQRGRDDVAVMVRLPHADRTTTSTLEDLRIRTRDGAEVPLFTVADVSIGRGLAEITRADRRRSINVTADVDTDTANANEIISKLTRTTLPALAAQFPGLAYGFEGQQRNEREFMEDMVSQAVLCLVVIFALLAIPLRSYIQPVIIMSVIPFGLVGAIWGHVFMNRFVMPMDITMMSMIGLIALSGVVVNDSLVIVDHVNRQRRKGVSIDDAVRHSGAARFRPILLTSLTTFAGLTPMLLERSLQAQFLIPMAVSLAFGILFATAITLILIPCLYFILEDVSKLTTKVRASFRRYLDFVTRKDRVVTER